MWFSHEAVDRPEHQESGREHDSGSNKSEDDECPSDEVLDHFQVPAVVSSTRIDPMTTIWPFGMVHWMILMQRRRIKSFKISPSSHLALHLICISLSESASILPPFSKNKSNLRQEQSGNDHDSKNFLSFRHVPRRTANVSPAAFLIGSI